MFIKGKHTSVNEPIVTPQPILIAQLFFSFTEPELFEGKGLQFKLSFKRQKS